MLNVKPVEFYFYKKDYASQIAPFFEPFLMQLPELEVWFQRATDVVRKLLYGDVDIGIVGFDMYSEIADQSSELIVLHDALRFGSCHLGLGIPTSQKFLNINTLDQLRR